MSRQSPSLQSGSDGYMPLASDPSAPVFDAKEQDDTKVTFLKPNVKTRSELAKFINSGGELVAGAPDTYSFASALYWLASCACCCFQQVTDNGPTQVTLGRTWENAVYADTSAVTRMLSCLTPVTNQWDLSALGRGDNSSYVSQDDIHLVYVPPGKYGLAILDGEPVLLDSGQGYHAFKTFNFEWRGLVDTNQDVIHLGTAYIINVKHGFVVIGNDPADEKVGVMVLQEGAHRFKSAVLEFNKNPVKTKLTQLTETLRISTFEPIELAVTISLTYNVNVDAAIEKFNWRQLQNDITFFVKQELQTVVSAAVRQIKYTELMSFQASQNGERNQGGSSVHVSFAPVDLDSKSEVASGEQATQNQLLDVKAIKSRLSSKFNEHGIGLDDFQIADINVSDAELRKEFQQANRRVVERRADLAAATVDAQVAETNARSKANAMQITAEAEANVVTTKAKAAAEAVRMQDEAMKEASPAAVQQALFAAAKGALNGANVLLVDSSAPGSGLIDRAAAALLGRAGPGISPGNGDEK